jgi:aryl-alcohol dehydrogenase-like predicted oxidoreductase
LETRRIRSLEVSLAGLGCNNFGWRIGPEQTAKVVDAALDAGINFFDTADLYGTGESEEFLGRVMGSRRNRIVLATKFGYKLDEQRPGGAKPAYIRQAVEGSLSRLRTDHIDLYQLHTPDAQTPIADTLGALNELVQSGKVREIGCSNFTAAQLREADEAAQAQGLARFVSVQNNYSLFHREPEAEVLPECRRRGVAFIPYFPLANGLLTGKYRAGKPLPEGSRAQDSWGPKVFTEQNLEIVERLIQFAESRGHTILELAFGWLLAQPMMASVIAGAKTAEQVKANAAAVTWKMTRDELLEIDALMGQPV